MHPKNNPAFHILTFKVFNDFNVVQGQIQILQLLQAAEILWISNTNTDVIHKSKDACRGVGYM